MPKPNTIPAEQLPKYLRENEADFDNIAIVHGKVFINVTWGDWKHSHARLDYLMKNAGWRSAGETVTESDGSDTYSSKHEYRPNQ